MARFKPGDMIYYPEADMFGKVERIIKETDNTVYQVKMPYGEAWLTESEMEEY